MADLKEIKQDMTAKSSHAEREERILSLWKEEGTFEASLEKEAPKGDFTFYDGPPFATGSPHYGHILAGTIKDVIPRWKTMQGYRVRRRWGWDCHGLPVENLIEKELGLKTKKDILTYGIGNFNAKARESVMRYADEWRTIVPRLGRWVDMDDDYRTMDSTYTETVWWIFKQLHEKGLVYEGFKSMNLCPRCETTLSNFEVAQGYKDITDISATAKFELVDKPGTFLLAWTTTPWTLPGNVALAVHPDVEYVEIKDASSYILAKDRYMKLKDEWIAKKVLANPVEARTFKGAELIGQSYKPIFDYYSKDSKLKNRQNGWKIYGADFVTTEDGTGIVHIAPAFGADDYELLQRYDLPFVQHVATDGTFRKEVTDFAGLHVKPIDTDGEKDAHQKTDIEIIKWLAHNGSLFAKEKLIHPYPHCWRCDTPLLNYATSSWFVRVTSIKDKLVAENKKVTWVPPEIGESRFGNWLAGARDWAVSRTRFWGAPIPVWKEEGTHGAHHFIGSLDELKRHSRAKNTYHVIRHGEAEQNVQDIVSSDPSAQYHLTAKGKEQVRAAAAKLKGQKFDLVFVSPLLRTRETADMLKSELGWKDDMIHSDPRLSELSFGEFDGKKYPDFVKAFPEERRFDACPSGGETYGDVKRRVGDFVYDIEKRYEGKNVLIVTHECPASLLLCVAKGYDRRQTLAFRKKGSTIQNAEARAVDFVPLPHNAEYELDLHRPFIDDIKLTTDDGRALVRVPDVFDCWFESGSMPYGEAHYPFEKDRFDFEPKSGLFKRSKGYPADFIAEGLDQTRGWFYSMIVLGVALFGKVPYKKVIVNGLVLAEDGQKMSKRKQNYPDPMAIVDKYGADSLRFYLMSSPVVHGQDLCFSEKGVDEVTKKVVNRILNVVSFYEMYAGETGKSSTGGTDSSNNPLDCWMMARLDETTISVTKGLNNGELDRAVRPLLDLTDDLSTWYLRRSRERFKGDDAADKSAAIATTRSVLLEMSKLLAPFMPFLAEDIYRRLNGAKPSVHLDSWPVRTTLSKEQAKLIQQMESVRKVVEVALALRSHKKIGARQPLASLAFEQTVKREPVSSDMLFLIQDEVNVKDVVQSPVSENPGATILEKEDKLFIESGGVRVSLDIAITPELKEEGDVRDVIRKVQDLRKEKGLSVGDAAVLIVPLDLQALATKHEAQIRAATNLSGIESGTALSLKP